MAQSGLAGSVTWGAGDGQGREPGARRRKVYGYLKAANELRQTYSAQWAQKNNQDYEYDDGSNVPGAFPDVEIARSGDEEMVIFPSYGRRHVKKRPQADMNRWPVPGADEDVDRPETAGNMEYWRQEWDKYEDDNAIVDVDVRGWIYSPQRGPMTRKHRLLIALARKLSGIPAPSPGNSRDSSQPPPSADKGAQYSSKQEEDVVNKEAQSIINNAEGQADAAWRGASSAEGNGQASLSRSSTATTQSSSMAKDELTIANAHLMARLRPFLTNPLVGTPITVFFFNEEHSQSRNVMTNESGHFSLRAALPFVPTQIRVLASEDLSASKNVQIIEPKGISLISDIDDTIKHSAIASGAREMFRNTFVRELGDLTINGVSEWYSKLASMGVMMHYVSNSPWQLYPLLESYFKLAGLPPGSFHLKQYSGMLQGIFEPTAERKKGSLERILRDFPERKFILVGDSGEADLEVYTDIVLANPGRVLGIFIRDVTTSDQKSFFDKSVDHLESAPKRNHSTGQIADHSDTVVNRPALPPRRAPEQSGPSSDANTIDNGDLIDLTESDDLPKNSSDVAKPGSARRPPVKPSKPSTLRTASTDPEQLASDDKDKETTSSQNQVIRRKPAPPLPDKPRRLSTPTRGTSPEQPPPLPVRPSQQGKPLPSSTARGTTRQSEQSQPESYATTVRNVVANAYNNLPSAREYLNHPSNNSSNLATGSESGGAQSIHSKQPPPVPPPRRSNTAASTASSNTARPAVGRQQSFPASAVASATQYASERLNRSSTPSSSVRISASTPSFGRTSTVSTNSDYNNGVTYSDSSGPPGPLPNKREELWRRRWERAKDVLDQHGVVLGSWRVGSDVQDVCVWLVEEAKKDMEQEEYNNEKKR